MTPRRDSWVVPAISGRHALRAAAAGTLVLVLLVALSHVYRDFFMDRRDRYRGASFAVHIGPLEYDRQVMREFTWGGWFWDPYRSMGMPRLQDLGMRPLYPPQLLLARLLPSQAAWHWNHVLHVLVKVTGLVLLCTALGWPLWVVVLAATGAMLAEGSLAQFGDTTMLLSAAWLPLQLWLTLEAARRTGFTVWDAAWSAVLALRVLSFHPQYGAYYEVLVVLFTLRVEWGRLRTRLPALALRYMAAGLLLAPALVPGYMHYLESGRRRILEFDDWHMRRAYLWWNYGLRWADFLTAAFVPWLAWAAIVAGAFAGRLSGTVLWPVFGAYLVFGLFHAVPYLALPAWLTGKALFPFRIPQRVFEPFMWLGVLLIAELVVREERRARRHLLGALLLVAVGGCLWQTQHDPREAYVVHRWSRPLPERLAATIRAAEPTHVAVLTGPEAMADDHQPVLNSNHADFLRIPAAHFAGQLPNYHFNRMAYRVPGMLLLPRGPTQLEEWEAAVDVYAELGIGWVIWDGEGDPVHPRLEPAGEEAGFRLFRIRGARSMIHALDSVRVVASPERPAGVAELVYGMPALGPFCYGCPDPARWSRADQIRLHSDWRPGDVTVTSEAPEEAFVVLNETRSLGWSAEIDGHPAIIYPVNEAFQGVLVPPGRHVIRWRFVSPGFFAGLAVAGIGVLVLVAASWRFGRGSRDPDA
jgi:hypothetical protein